MIRREGEPAPGARCICAHRVLATLEETLACPAGFLFRPGIGFIHVLWVNR